MNAVVFHKLGRPPAIEEVELVTTKFPLAELDHAVEVMEHRESVRNMILPHG